MSRSRQAKSVRLFRNDYFSIRHEPELSLLALEWTPATDRMGSGDFQGGLLRLADLAEKCTARRLLVDVRQFRFQMTPTLVIWRDEQIAPRYNRAGVDRFAYVVRDDFPIPPFDGKPLSKKEWFRTCFFTQEQNAREWLTS